jgi:AAA family ATP:ADP antiporter
VNNGSLVGICVASFLIFNARWMGKMYDEYMDVGYVVGGDNGALGADYGEVGDDEEQGGLEMQRAGDEDNGDTSCGFEDEGQLDEGVGEEEEEEEEGDDEEEGRN